jgi:hypothetical protein
MAKPLCQRADGFFGDPLSSHIAHNASTDPAQNATDDRADSWTKD